jgi:hypothetical protein
MPHELDPSGTPPAGCSDPPGQGPQHARGGPIRPGRHGNTRWRAYASVATREDVADSRGELGGRVEVERSRHSTSLLNEHVRLKPSLRRSRADQRSRGRIAPSPSGPTVVVRMRLDGVAGGGDRPQQPARAVAAVHKPRRHAELGHQMQVAQNAERRRIQASQSSTRNDTMPGARTSTPPAGIGSRGPLGHGHPYQRRSDARSSRSRSSAAAPRAW